MNSLFKNHIKTKVDELVSNGGIDYKPVNKKIGQSSLSIVYAQCDGGASKFIEIQFVPHKSFVFLQLRWSRKGRFPSDDCVDPNDIRENYKDNNSLYELDEALLNGAMIGASASVELDSTTPKESFVKKVYTKNRAQKLADFVGDDIAGDSYEDFLELAELDGWDALAECFGDDIFSADDLNDILTPMIVGISDFIFNHAAPFLDRV